MIKCAMCDTNEANVFFVFDQWANVWRYDPEEYVCCRCDSCFAQSSGRKLITVYKHHRVPISKDDYLAALAMAEL